MKTKNNSGKLKVLTEFGSGNHKSLLIELDKTIIDKLEIDENGMVDTLDFISIYLIELSQKMSAKKAINLHQLIFDGSIAVDARRRQ